MLACFLATRWFPIPYIYRFQDERHSLRRWAGSSGRRASNTGTKRRERKRTITVQGETRDDDAQSERSFYLLSGVLKEQRFCPEENDCSRLTLSVFTTWTKWNGYQRERKMFDFLGYGWRRSFLILLILLRSSFNYGSVYTWGYIDSIVRTGDCALDSIDGIKKLKICQCDREALEFLVKNRVKYLSRLHSW